MHNMKNIFIYTLVVVTLIMVVNNNTQAAPIGTSNMGRDYLVNSDPLDNWSVGIFGGIGKRGIDLESGGKADLDINRAMIYVGYDLFSWVTPFAALGVTSSEISSFSAGNGKDTKFAYGAGLLFNILNQEIMDPNLMIDQFRINADVYYNGSETEGLTDTYTWGEFSASLTLGLVNDTVANKELFPESIGIYLGPIYSYYASSDFDADTTLGLLTGLNMFFTKRTSFDISAQIFDEVTINGSLNIRF